MVTLKNASVEVAIAEYGAELLSIKSSGEELLWWGDKAFWGRHAPILFPIVGRVWNDEFRVEGKVFQMGQHGFARDADFEVVAECSSEAVFVLRSSEATLEKYPYPFELEAYYALEGATLRMRWCVRNVGDGVMYYQIGAHPAFLYRGFDGGEECHGFLQLLKGGREVDKVVVSHLDERGGVADERREMMLEGCLLPLTDRLFAGDALIMEDAQVDGALLLDKGGNPYLRVDFERCPVLGVWSPKGKGAPFVCVEPWMGRADRVDFEGDISQREWINSLQPGESGVFHYSVSVL